MSLFECFEYGGGISVGDGYGVNVVTVVVIEDEDVVVAGAGGQRETSGLITVCFSCWRSVDYCCKCVVRAFAFVKGLGECSVIFRKLEEWELCWFNRFGGLCSLSLLFHMPFGCGWWSWWVFAQVL